MVSLSLTPQEEKQILYNLYSLYLHDLSSFTNDLDISENGSFAYDSFDLIWETDGLAPYFLKDREKIVGFLLLLERPFLKKGYDYSINDIFMLRKFRGKGITILLLKELFKQKRGKYVVAELAKNKPAVSFWRKAYQKLNINFEEKKQVIDNEICFVQTFRV
ncbi:GNAT family N-acetyltransferase [Virgibacillus sp. AGTR]|uniref:GNAT family N-acetyltransferase n=1 Tax=Virgibacillus sp. AGTR TaxID=2812055 RepID=UPI0019648BD4|nr:GNAT family N-acetyltransferase [Virgibacillus sp. AGTR]MCC2249390.1 GNAT family N-acetyltransferase [Virgibacillus sp. AGTR]QRZ18818.1 GNAT family N-acetyltransferase [Virgibacillus sp. AGTR]